VLSGRLAAGPSQVEEQEANAREADELVFASVYRFEQHSVKFQAGLVLFVASGTRRLDTGR
jgi:hypothetical protein